MPKTQGWTSKITAEGIVFVDGSVTYEPVKTLVEALHCLCDEDIEGRIQFAWNLDEFIAPLLQLIDEPHLKHLVHNHWLTIQNFGKILYIPSKVFGIYQFDEEPVSFYSLNQYFPDIEDPKDANLIWGLADLLVNTLEGMGIRAKAFTSPAKLYEDGILKHCDIPTAFTIKEKECVEYAWHCAGRPWIECLQIGYFENTFDYDIVAAYSSMITKLQNTNHAVYTKSTTMIENADWGFLKGRVTINPEIKVSPITHRLPDGSIINPRGSWDEWLTLDAVKFIYRWNIGSFKLYNGWFLKFTTPFRPLEVPMTKLFAWRGQKDLRDMLAKRMANGAIGKFLEEHKDGREVGQFYNPLFGAMVQERTRLEVGRFIYVNKLWDKNIIAVNTDGVLSTKDVGMKIKVNPKHPKKMGQWRLSYVGPAIAESSGNVFYADKRPHGITYEALLSAIKANPNQAYYNINGSRLVTINDVVDGKATWKELGKMKTFATSSIDLVKLLALAKTKKLDRDFPKIPQSGKELLENTYTSEPLEIGE